MALVRPGDLASNLFTLYPNCKHSTGDTFLPRSRLEWGLKTNLSLAPSVSWTAWVFVTSSQLETVSWEGSSEWQPRPACEAPLKMLPLQILCEPRGMDNKWNFNDFRLQILNYLIFMSRNVLHVRCYVRVNSTPQSHFPLQTGGVTLMLILEEENNLLPTIHRLIFPAHCTLTHWQSNNVRGTLLLDSPLQISISFYCKQRSFHLKFETD